MANIFDTLEEENRLRRPIEPVAVAPRNVFDIVEQQAIQQPEIEPEPITPQPETDRALNVPLQPPVDDVRGRPLIPPVLKTIGQALTGMSPIPKALEAQTKLSKFRKEKFGDPIQEAVESVVPPEVTGQAVSRAALGIPGLLIEAGAKKVFGEEKVKDIQKQLGSFTVEVLADAATDPLVLIPTLKGASALLKKSPKAFKTLITGALRAKRLKDIRKVRALRPKITPIGQVGQPITPEVIPEDPVTKITQALQATKPLLGKQEAIFSAERAKRVARVAAVGKKVPGEAGFHAQLGQLKGQLPKVKFESIRQQIKQPDIDSLFNLIEDGKTLTPFDKVTAKTGLSKLLGAEGGALPTKGELSLLGEIFPKEFVQAVLSNRSTTEKLFSGIGNVINLPRAMMATADLSAPLRQGVFFIGRPKQFLPAFKDMFRFAGSEKAYQGFMQSIKARPTYRLMKESKLSLTELGANLAAREEAFMSNLAERIPIFGRIARGSNRAYTGFLNKLRADVFDDLVKSANQLGIIKQRPGVVKDIAKFINNATGRGDIGDLGEAAIILNGAFFSPRLAMSRFNLLLNPTFYMRLDPFARKEALKSLITFAGAGASVLGLAKAGGLEVGVDPRSADFGKIKTGDTRFDIWGGFQQYAVAVSRLAANTMVSSTTGREIQFGEGFKPITRADIVGRFFNSKLSPVASFGLDLLRGRTAIGEKVRVVPNIIDRFIPMVAQDMFELYRDEGVKGLAMALPAVFGTGVQTYGDQIPLKAKTASGREKIEWRQEPGIGETLYNKVTGTIITDIPKSQQKKLATERRTETLRKIELSKVKREVLETGKTQFVGDTKVFMDRGVVKTKRRKRIRRRF